MKTTNPRVKGRARDAIGCRFRRPPTKVMRRLALTIAVLLAGFNGSISSSVAQDQPTAEALKAAQALVSVISASMTSDIANQLSARAWPQTRNALISKYPQIDDATLEKLRAEYLKFQTSALTDLLKASPALYARYFTAKELNEIRAFYRTPVGAKTLTVMPKITSEFMKTALPRIVQKQETLTKALDAILRQRGYTK